MEEMNNIVENEAVAEVATEAVDSVVEATKPEKGKGLLGWIVGGAIAIGSAIVGGILWHNHKKKAKTEEKVEAETEEKTEPDNEVINEFIYDENGDPIEK